MTDDINSFERFFEAHAPFCVETAVAFVLCDGAPVEFLEFSRK